MKGRPPFDSQRAAFILIAFVIAVYAVVIIGGVAACIYYTETIITTDAQCDPQGKLFSLLAAALSAALAFSGLRDK